MGINYNPKVVTDGLVLNLDAANSRSLSNVTVNMLRFTEDFSNTAWVKQLGNTVLSNTTIAPDGTLTADTLVRVAATAEDYQNFSCVLGSTYTFSLWLRADANITARIKLGRTSNNPQVTTVCSLTNTWQRFSVTWTADITGQGFANIDTTIAGSIQVWGAQLEQATTASTYYSVGSGPRSVLWSDLSGQNNNGTLLNSPTFTSVNNGSLAFNGVNQQVTLGNTLSTLTNMTLECWVNFSTQVSSFNGIISKTLDNSNGYELRTTGFSPTTTTFEFRYKGDLAATTAYTATNGLWYHVTATGKLGEQRFYINGQLHSSNNIATVPDSNNNSLEIGKLAYAGLYLKGAISVVRIYNKVLSTNEVTQNFNALRGRYGV